jgi:hypothetical protein
MTHGFETCRMTCEAVIGDGYTTRRFELAHASLAPRSMSRGKQIADKLVTWRGPDDDGCLHFHRLDWVAGQRLDLLDSGSDQLRVVREHIAAAIDQAIAEEREACAKLANDDIAKVIRARAIE